MKAACGRFPAMGAGPARTTEGEGYDPQHAMLALSMAVISVHRILATQKDSAVAVTEFRGEQCNFYGLLKHMESPDRQERKEAFHAWAALYEKISPEMRMDLFDASVFATTRWIEGHQHAAAIEGWWRRKDGN